MAMSHRWRSFHIGCIVFLFLILALSHYHELLVGIPVIGKIWIALPFGLSRHVVERFISPLLVAYASWVLGLRSVIVIWLASALVMLPQALIVSSNPRDALAESIATLAISGLVIALIRMYQLSQRQQEVLTSSQRSYEELFTNASDAIWVHDLDGNITLANKATKTITGYSPSELIGKNISQFFSPEALLLAREVKAKLMKGETLDQRYEQHIIRNDNTMAIVELATRPIKTDDRLTAFQHIARDVTEERNLRDNLRVQIHNNLIAQEEERKRIARELHDDIAQSILLLSRRIDILMSETGRRLSESVKSDLKQMHGLANEIYKNLQRYARDLRPSILDQLGLVAALNWLSEEISKEMEIKVEVKAGRLPTLPSETELVMFRIAQEALNNIRKHAEASEVSITLESDISNMKMTITDNGKGFSIPKSPDDLAKEGKLGLLGMKERACLIGCNLDIKSEHGKGTSVIVELPV